MEIKSVFELLEETKKFTSVFDIMEKEPEFKWEKAPKEMGVRPVTELLEEKPVVQIAKAQVSYNISQKTGIDILEVERNLPAITKQLGIRGVPTAEEHLAAMFAFPVTAALIANPISAGIGVSKFLALTEAENYAISKLKKWEYKFGAGRGLKELLPESTVQWAKDITDVFDFMAKGYAIAKTDPAIMKMWHKFTRDISTTYNIPKQMYISAEKIKSIFKTGEKISKAESDLITSLGLNAKQYKEAIKSGIDIQIPPEKIITITDKPIWASIKGLLRIKPYSKMVVSSAGKVRPAKLLIEGAAEVSMPDAIAFLLKEGVTQNTLNKLKPSTIKDLYYARKFGAAYGKKELVPKIPEAEKAEITEVPPEVEKLPEGVIIEAKLPEVPSKELVSPEGVILSEISKAEGPIMARVVKRLWESGVKTLESNMGGKGTYSALQRSEFAKTHTYIDTDKELDSKVVQALRKAGFTVKIKRAQIEVGVDDWDWEDIHEISFLSPKGSPENVDRINESKLMTIADILIAHVGKPELRPRVTREEFIDRLTKKNAGKAPVVTALEEAKAKPSEEAEKKLRVAVESAPTRDQEARIKFLVGQKGLLTPTNKQKAQHRAFLEALTGEQSIRKMNQGQVQLVIDTLERWHPKTVRAVYETPVKYITPELIDMLQGFREIGLKEDFRDAYHVWQKIGPVREIYEATEKAEVDLVERIEADTKIALQYEKLTKDIPNSFGRVFRHPLLNNTATKEDISYTPEELETVKWLKTHFDKWADDLELPPEKRRKHYITNIIEAAIVKDLKQNKFLNVDYLRAMEYGPGAKEIFHPYLQARKGLKGKGVKEDWRTAFQAYEGYSARKLYYDPILQKISLISKFLPPNAERYAREYKKRMTGELTAFDKKANFTLREMGEVIAKLPGGKGFAEFLMKGNPAGTISYHAAGLLYVSYLGLMPRSSIRNASQSSLTIAETGAKAFLKGGDWLRTAEGQKTLKNECVILRQRRFAALPGLDISALRGKLKTAEDAALYLFKFPDIKFSVPRAFGAGYVEARDLGLPHDYCVRRGNEVARKCQYAYSGMASSLVSQSSGGRVLGVFTTWPRNFVELLHEWTAGKPSQVYLDYKKDTGTDVMPEAWAAKRAALIRYLAIVALASVIERKTAFRATEYTGWTSLKSIPRILAGDLAGLQIPAGAVGLVLGMAERIATGDPYQMKKAWAAIRPDKQVLLVKSLKDVFDGKKDWLDLLLYLEKGEGLKKYPRLR